MRKKGLKISRMTKKFFVGNFKKVEKGLVGGSKKVKKVFVSKKHHHKKANLPAMKSINSTFIQPTATTFTSSFKLSEVLLTITDPNYNYFFGYPSNLPGGSSKGVEYYKNSKYLIGGPRKHCGGCCDNKIIIVTRAPDERLI